MKLNIQLFADGSVIIEASIDTNSFDKQIAYLEYQLEELEETYKLALKDPDWDEKDLKKMEAEMEITSRKIDRLQKQQLALNQTTRQYSNSFGDVASKLTKMGLAIFGIRSAYMLIRQSMSQLAQDNDTLANKLNTIKSALANAIAPIAEGLINIVYKLLAYLNVITKTFLGVDLFAKTSKGAKSTAKSLKSASGSTKEIRKQLAGFDEMNILSKDTPASGGAGGGGGGFGDITSQIKPPDTSEFEKVVKKFKEAWNEILKIDREEAKRLFLNGEDTWGALKLLVFDFTQGSVKAISGLGTSVKGVWDMIVGWANNDSAKIDRGQKELISGLKGYWEGFKQIVKGVIEFPYNFGVTIGNKIRTFFVDKVIKPITDKIDAIKKKIQDNFKEGFWKSILNIFIGIFNKVINKLNDKLTISIGSTTRKILSAIGVDVPAGGYSLFKIPTIPKLAKGGIVNMPGRGVMMGNYIAGENGPEAVLPLTDDTLQRLANMIPITINLTNSMNGRVISRELQKINQENSFASNR